MDATSSRTVLGPLEPIGLGTPDAESAESYVWRLADVHGVPRQTLHKFINSHGPEIYRNLRGQLPRLDGPTLQAATYMRRVADLVGRPDVYSLGLGWLAGLVRAQHVLRGNRAWCSDCIAEMRIVRTRYAPLAWSLASVSHCARHSTRLLDHCLSCGGESSIRRVGHEDWGRCASCGHPQAMAAPEADVAPSMLEAAVLEQMGLLVSTIVPSNVELVRPTFSEMVTSLHRQGHRVNPGAMARRMGVSKGTVSSLMSGHAQPGIDLLLRLSTAYGVELPDLLLKRGAKEAWLTRSKRHDLIVWPARTKPRIDWGSAQQGLDLHLAAEAALPVAQVARRLGVDARHLATRRPDRAAALTQRYQEGVGRKRRAEGEQMLALLQAADDGVSQRAVARSVGTSRRRRRFREAWRSMTSA